jgi:HEAT repeat protein
MDESVYTLIQQTYHADQEVQERSARALGACDLAEYRHQAIHALCGVLSHPDLAIREAAKTALIQIGGTDVVDALIPYLKGASTTALNYALEILAAIGRDGIDRILGLLDSRDHNLRKFGCDLLGNLQYHDSVYDLIDLLSDPHINVAIAAGEALGKLGSREAVPRLIRALQYPDSWMRCIAAEALGKIGDTRAVDAFLTVPDDEEPMVVYTMIKAMGNLHDVRMVPHILKLLRLNPNFASSAIQALTQLLEQNDQAIYDVLQTPEALSELLGLLANESRDVALAAITLVGRLHDPDAAPALRHLRHHTDEGIAAAAAAALQQIDSQQPQRE